MKCISLKVSTLQKKCPGYLWYLNTWFTNIYNIWTMLVLYPFRGKFTILMPPPL